MRICNRCKTEKNFTEYPKEKGGFATVCKPCKNERSKKYYEANRIQRLQQMAAKRQENPELFNSRNRNYYHNNKEDIVIRRAMRRNENPETYRNYWLKAKYSISSSDYDNMYAQQEGRCRICNRHASTLSRPLVVDHDHTSGNVRSLLCINCNTGLGQFKESFQLLNNAITYLEEYLA